MPRASLGELVARRRRERADDGERYVDMRLDVLDDAGSSLLSVGGRFDRRADDYVADATQARVMRAHPGQVDFVRWFDGWLEPHLEGREIPDAERIYSALLAGGQRAGKTQAGVCVSSVAYAVAVPGSIVWIVVASDRDTEEVDAYLQDTMPLAWYRRLGSPWFRYELANGSRIVMRSGHWPQNLKKGRADLIVMNEAQRMKESAFAICRARIADKGGLLIGCANPPDSPQGAWVGDWAVEAEAGLRQSRYFYFDPFRNPHIDHGPLHALRAELDERTFQVEVEGRFLTVGDTVFYNWDRAANERVAPEVGDITAALTERFEGRAFDRVVGVDVQRHPHMASVEFQFFANPAASGTDDRFHWSLMWATREVVLDGADEFELAQAWLDLGWDPERTLIVCDASGEWQFSERDRAKLGELRQQVKGRGSFDVFRRMGFPHVRKPDRKSEKNPDLLERCRATTARIRTSVDGPHGQHFLFSDPSNVQLNRSIRNWPIAHGKPSRTSQYAHLCDAFSYPVVRFFPRRKLADPDHVGVSVKKRIPRGDPWGEGRDRRGKRKRHRVW